jgi:hypothetical protein
MFVGYPVRPGLTFANFHYMKFPACLNEAVIHSYVYAVLEAFLHLDGQT